MTGRGLRAWRCNSDCVNHRPCTITPSMRVELRTSSSGLAETKSRSARLPTPTVPNSFALFKTRPHPPLLHATPRMESVPRRQDFEALHEVNSREPLSILQSPSRQETRTSVVQRFDYLYSDLVHLRILGETLSREPAVQGSDLCSPQLVEPHFRPLMWELIQRAAL